MTKHSSEQDKDIQELLQDNYQIIKRIGSGSFGEVYLCRTKDNTLIASKIEEIAKSKRLYEEYKIYKRLNKRGFTEGIPRIFDFIQTPKFNILNMELLGQSLDSVFNKSGKKFTLQTVLTIGINIITLLEKLHKTGFIHRDIKPNNFLIGFGDNKNKIYLTDFGLSKQYIEQNEHIPYKTDKSLIGTARYASHNMHMGIEPSRRDDLESVGYMLIYFLKGTLPWQGIKKTETKTQIELIGEKKICISLNKLCQDIPLCFYKYLEHTKNLSFNEKPDYDLLRNLFKSTLKDLNFEEKYEWCT